MQLDSLQPQGNNALSFSGDVGKIRVERAEADEFVRVEPYLLRDEAVDIVDLLRHSRHGLHHSHVDAGFLVDFEQGIHRAVKAYFQIVEAAYSVCRPCGNLIWKYMCMCIDYHFHSPLT